VSHEQGATQVVILGAGMDTRPYRMPEMRAVRIWELDLPTVQAAKKSAITRAMSHPPGHVNYVPTDLAAQQAPQVLADNGVNPRIRTLLVCEAVSQYLPQPAVESIFAYTATLPAGSRLVEIDRVVVAEPQQPSVPDGARREQGQHRGAGPVHGRAGEA
jgi:methyltransferase (TIGR00027 family)